MMNIKAFYNSDTDISIIILDYQLFFIIYPFLNVKYSYRKSFFREITFVILFVKVMKYFYTQ